MISSALRNMALIAAATLIAGCATIDRLDPPAVETIAAQNMDRFLRTSQAHAISVAITFEGRNYTAHLGTLDPEKSVPPTDESLYEIASITKTFTGIIAARAVLEGKLSLDDDIRRYLEGDYPNLEIENEPIRIRHLLTHTSGLPSNTKGMSEALAAFPPANGSGANWRLIYKANEQETRDTFLEYLGEVSLSAVPGDTFNYSNYGTNLTAHILERVYNKSYAQLLAETVLNTAGMEDAALIIDPANEHRRVLGYNEIGESIPRLTIADVLWGADGGVKASVVDMANYMEWQLDQLAPAFVPEARRRLDQRDIGYWIGYFWWVIDTETGAQSYRHDGGGAGVKNVLILYPENDLAIYAVTNKSTPEMNGQLTSLVRSIRSDLIR